MAWSITGDCCGLLSVGVPVIWQSMPLAVAPLEKARFRLMHAALRINKYVRGLVIVVLLDRPPLVAEHSRESPIGMVGKARPVRL